MQQPLAHDREPPTAVRALAQAQVLIVFAELILVSQVSLSLAAWLPLAAFQGTVDHGD
jgi:hypothetical protein